MTQEQPTQLPGSGITPPEQPVEPISPLTGQENVLPSQAAEPMQPQSVGDGAVDSGRPLVDLTPTSTQALSPDLGNPAGLGSIGDQANTPSEGGSWDIKLPKDGKYSASSSEQYEAAQRMVKQLMESVDPATLDLIQRQDYQGLLRQAGIDPESLRSVRPMVEKYHISPAQIREFLTDYMPKVTRWKQRAFTNRLIGQLEDQSVITSEDAAVIRGVLKPEQRSALESFLYDKIPGYDRPATDEPGTPEARFAKTYQLAKDLGQVMAASTVWDPAQSGETPKFQSTTQRAEMSAQFRQQLGEMTAEQMVPLLKNEQTSASVVGAFPELDEATKTRIAQTVRDAINVVLTTDPERARQLTDQLGKVLGNSGPTTQ